LGAEVVESVAFGDHQRLGEADALRLLALAARHGAVLVATAKDMARLSGAHGALSDLAAATRLLPIALSFAEADTQRLSGLIARLRQPPVGRRQPQVPTPAPGHPAPGARDALRRRIPWGIRRSASQCLSRLGRRAPWTNYKAKRSCRRNHHGGGHARSPGHPADPRRCRAGCPGGRRTIPLPVPGLLLRSAAATL